MQVSEHYTGRNGRLYFAHRQPRRARKAQRSSAQLFITRIPVDATVLDFGCGTGEILSAINCGRRIGIEINEDSIQLARNAGVEVHLDIAEIERESVDVVISHHALEHIIDPHRIITEFFRVLKPGGHLIIVVPCEPGRRSPFRCWQPNRDMHLYSWNPLSLGNLITACGFEVRESYVAAQGYSRYNAWLSSIPPVFATSKWLVSRLLNRFATVSVAVKPALTAQIGAPAAAAG